MNMWCDKCNEDFRYCSCSKTETVAAPALSQQEAVDHHRLVRAQTTITLKTLCNVCQAPLTCEWPENMTYGGEAVTPQQYMACALRNAKTLIVCDDCLAKMPDVKLEDMRLAP